MNKTKDPNNPVFHTGDIIGGYLLKRAIELPEIESFYYELEHVKTGAKHVHISRNDKENTFAAAFKTVPQDSTGVAHILEHTVLCGSKKYPVRDPFFSMLKRSLSTFMNAFTSSDWTMYPFSTQNRKDFYNLMDIYLDATFYPILSELNFEQEGHRLEIEEAPGKDPELVYKGVVYNEMKGAMSSADQVMGRSLLNALYPDTTYQYNSGGDPSEIPKLTYEQLKAFHRRHYHPSNSFFYTYGDIALKDHLHFIEEKILQGFTKTDPQTDVPSQPRWDKPRTATYYYPLSKSEDPSKKCQVALAWLQADILDTFEVLVLSILEQILIGNPASPLRKALIDSGLGAALSDASGYGADMRDTMFSVGLKGVELSSAETIENLILETLKDLAANGIDPQLVESAIHQIEFHRKEVTNTPYPYGIKLLLAFGGNWFHGVDPVRILKFDDDLEKLKTYISQGPFLEQKIEEYFTDNTHRVLFKLAPDQQKEEKENQKAAKELKSILKKLSFTDLEKIRQQADALKKLQESAEDLSVLPTLELSEIAPQVQKVIETAQTDSSFLYQQPTSGIFYFASAAGVGNLSKELLPLVPFFCYALPKSGVKNRDYTEVVRRIDLYTGGISLSAQARTGYGGKDPLKSGTCVPFITFNGKCLVRNMDKMFEIIQEFFTEYNFFDLGRLKNLLLEYQAKLESSIVQNGHRLAISMASRNFSITSGLSETWQGIHQVKTIKSLAKNLTDSNLSSIAKNLNTIGQTVFIRENMKIALIGEENPLSRSEQLESLIFKSLAKGDEDGFKKPDLNLDESVPREGWTTSTAVSFVARVFETVRFGHDDAPALSVIAKVLRSLFLHREIREKGGAYGGFSIYSPEDGQFCMASYRDPHIVNTLNVYEKAFEFIRSGAYSDEDIKEAVLQVCSEIDKPDPPGPAARKAFYRKILSLSDDARDRYKQQLLGLKREKIIRTAEKYFRADATNHGVVVVSGEEQILDANKSLGDHRLSVFPI
ncbi:MAG: insulinase family protein [Desulfobacterales bacterium]